MTLGQRIKTRRIELGMTQEELAKKAGYKEKSIISKIELDKTYFPIKKIEHLAECLSCSSAFLMGYDSEDANSHKAQQGELLEKLKDNLVKQQKFTNHLHSEDWNDGYHFAINEILQTIAKAEMTGAKNR